MRRPAWASSRGPRRWLAVAAVGLLLLAGRVALRSFGTEAVLSDGATVKADCEAAWRSAVVGPPQQRFTLWVMIGGSGQRREEAIETLGGRCRTRARVRLGFTVSLLAIGGLGLWLAVPVPRKGPDL